MAKDCLKTNNLEYVRKKSFSVESAWENPKSSHRVRAGMITCWTDKRRATLVSFAKQQKREKVNHLLCFFYLWEEQWRTCSRGWNNRLNGENFPCLTLGFGFLHAVKKSIATGCRCTQCSCFLAESHLQLISSADRVSLQESGKSVAFKNKDISSGMF